MLLRILLFIYLASSLPLRNEEQELFDLSEVHYNILLDFQLKSE